jgi:hypothetical protein
MFEAEVPLSINISDDNKLIVVGTNMNNHYKIDLPEMRNRTLILENDRYAFKCMALR